MKLPYALLALAYTLGVTNKILLVSLGLLIGVTALVLMFIEGTETLAQYRDHDGGTSP